MASTLNLSYKSSKWRFRFNQPARPWKHQMWPNIFLLLNIQYRCHWKQSNCKRPTCYTIITLFDQNRKYYNQNNKNLHLVSHIALQAASLNGSTESSNSVPGSSDRHVLLLTEGNFEIIWNLNKILVRVMRYNICDHTYK